MFLTVPRSDLALGERLERRLLLLGVLLLEERLAREDDVAALLVDLDHAHPELLPLQRVEVADRTDVDLRAGQERAHADVHGEAALDALDDAADDDLAVGVGLLDLVPDLHLLGLLARQHDVAFTILGALEQHVDHVARLHGDVAVFVEELVNLDEAFGLVADVDDDGGFGDLQHGALDDLAFRHVAEAVVVDAEHGRELLRVHVFVVHRLESRPGRLARSGASRCPGLSARLIRATPTRFLRSPFRARPPQYQFPSTRLSLHGLAQGCAGFCCGDRPPAAITAMENAWWMRTEACEDRRGYATCRPSLQTIVLRR